MRTALALALLATALPGCGSARAQPADEWPTPSELRQELADDGWEWAAHHGPWVGGRGWQAENWGATLAQLAAARGFTP